jgi:archaellum component FlaC
VPRRVCDCCASFWLAPFFLPCQDGSVTIDERLEHLVERHEALTQTVELLTHDIAELRSITTEHGQYIRTLAENVSALVRIVESHERHIRDLER